MSILNLKALTLKSVPDPTSPDFQHFIDDRFSSAESLISNLSTWPKKSTKINGTVQIVHLDKSPAAEEYKKPLGISEYWCGRLSTHNSGDIQGGAGSRIYERFRKGLLENHSEHEREYIEACHTIKRLHVYTPGTAEVWQLTYNTPPPTNSRTFVILLLSRESTSPEGRRSFTNVSIPFDHPECAEKTGDQKNKVRGRYVSVERIEEMNADQVEWRMATSSDAGGNIPRFMTNSSLPSSISEDVPSFLKWLGER